MERYELIHLSRSLKGFDLSAAITIGTRVIKPKPRIRLQIDTKLKRGPQLQEIQRKMVKQSIALTKISTSIWGATFTKARQMYTAVVRPAMTYGSTIWPMLNDAKTSLSTSKLSVMQNRYLRTIADAFKSTPIPVLEAETHITPIDLHLDQLQAKARYCLRVEGQSKSMAQTSKTIANRLPGKAGRKRVQKPTPGEQKHDRAKDWLSDSTIAPPPDPYPPWSEASPSHRDKIQTATALQRKHHQQIRVRHTNAWTSLWGTYQNRVTESSLFEMAENTLVAENGGECSRDPDTGPGK